LSQPGNPEKWGILSVTNNDLCVVYIGAEYEGQGHELVFCCCPSKDPHSLHARINNDTLVLNNGL